MAGWISSKLKVAENLLHQIDQQAAESLRKGESKQSDDVDVNSSQKSSGTVPLRDQLKKKSPNADEYFGKLSSSSANYSENKSSSDDISKVSKQELGKDVTTKPNLNLKSIVKDSDWTELLNTPKKPTVTKTNRRSGVQKDGGEVGKGGLNVKGNGKVVGKTVRKSSYGDAEKANGAVGDLSTGSDRKVVEESGSSSKFEIVEGDKKVEHERGMMGDEECLEDDKSIVKVDSSSLGYSECVSALVSDEGIKTVCDDEKSDNGTLRTRSRDEDVANNVSGGLKSAFHSGSDHESDSESSSSSSSDSGFEQEREEKMQRRRQILAAKAAAKALEAIKEQENVVARLEGEKQSLEKILEEQANQAALEASELQSMMMETMEAAELEKQKHNHTRMEVLAQLAKLETANADLAKSLATAQWNLEMEVNHLAELRHQVEVKEVVLEELKRKMYCAHQTRTTLTSLAASKGFEMQKEMLEAECAFATDKIASLQEKVMKLEVNINTTLKETESLTEVEIELRRRLRQMTDHLIQKQAQVESLSSNKATLLFRIEAVSRLLDENKSLTDGGDISGSSRDELEMGKMGTWESTGSKLRPILETKIQSGKQHLGSLLRQLDAIFSAGAVFLARNPAAKLWSWVYLVSLHLWVLYILFSQTQATEDATPNFVISLENINGSIGV